MDAAYFLNTVFPNNFYIRISTLFIILCVCLSCQVESWVYSTEDAIIFEVEPHGLKFKRGNRQLGSNFRPSGHTSDPASAESTSSSPHSTEIGILNECYTSSDKEGRCISFKNCFPLLFVNGELKNPGLGEILHRSAGPCNSSLHYDIPIVNANKRTFTKEGLDKQFVCCAGYKEALRSSQSHRSKLDSEFSSKLPSIDPVESTLVEREVEKSEENHKSNLEGDSNRESLSDIELEITDSINHHLVSANNNHIKVPVLPQPTYDLSPWYCPGRQIFMPRGQWPWMVALLNDGRHFCSGTIIDKIHLLTSASCIYQLSAKDVAKVRVIIGDRVMYTTQDGPHFWRKVVRITRHIQYNHQTLHNDIAILAMDSPIQYTQNIQPVNLPVTENRSHLSKAIVTGWSGVDIAKPFYDARPTRDSVLELMDWRECNKIYDGFATGGVTRDMLCTKTSNLSCISDPGGPLVAKTENCWHLIGIVSFSLSCGFMPEVYTDVARYLPWIQKNIKHYQHKSVHEILPP